MIATFRRCALALLCIALPTTTRTFDGSYIPKIVLAGATGYFASQVYVAYNVDSAVQRLASVRYILATHPYQQTQCQQALKREILRKHDQMVHSYWFGASAYATIPLVWYVKKLDSAIYSLSWLSWLNADGERAKVLTDLLLDLHTIRDYIVTDYDYIREQRMYLNKKQ